MASNLETVPQRGGPPGRLAHAPAFRKRALCGAGASSRSPREVLWRGTGFGFSRGSVGWRRGEEAWMLPAGSAHRLVSLLTQALDGCAEQKQKLRQKTKQCQALLRDWNSEVSESATLEGSKNDCEACVEKEPSAKELEELELLNKALEKALRVRTKFQPAPGEGAKPTGKKAAGRASLSRQVDNVSKESAGRAGRAASVIRKPASPKRPTAYIPKAPYRTDPTVKRWPPAKTSSRPGSRASKMPGRKQPSPGMAFLTATLPVTVTQPGCDQSCVAKEPGKQVPCAFGASVGQRDAAAGANLPLPEAEPDLSDPAGACSATWTQMASTLQEKGSLLELPHPYKKAFSKYMSLLEKCQGCQTSPEAAAARDRFVEKMRTTFCSPSPTFSPVEVRRELLHLKGVCSLMRHCMEAETPASLGENPTWERQYESLLTLEGLQAIVQEQLDKVQQLREAMESHAELLPADLVGGKGCSSQGKTCLGTERCWDAEAIGPPPLLFYSSSKELMDMEALKLKVARLHQRLEIQKAMEAELLPLLEPGHLEEGSRVLLFRAIYTLLCEGSESFPVLVNDNVE